MAVRSPGSSTGWGPALTPVDGPAEAMWTRAADYLLGAMEKATLEPVQREIEVELVVRASTGRAPGRRASAG